jgi:hypothetical protein
MKLAGCFLWMAVYAALTWAISVVVLRRLEVPQIAIGGSAIIALMACVAFAHLIHVLRVALDLGLRFTRQDSAVVFDGTKAAVPAAKVESMPKKVRRAASGLMNGVVYAALAAGIAALLFAFSPLEHGAPSWEEIHIETLLDENVRTRITKAEIIPLPPPARTLQPGDARGRFKVGEREWIVNRAAHARDETEEKIALFSGDNAVAVITIDARGGVTMQTPSGWLTAPNVTTDIRQIAGGWIGRITWSEGHLVFRV